MFVRLTRLEADPSKVQQLILLYEKSIVPAAKEQAGFRGTYLLTDRSTGRHIAVTLWVSEEDALANESSGYYQEQVDKVAPYLSASPIREGYEVTVHDFDIPDTYAIPMSAPTEQPQA